MRALVSLCLIAAAAQATPPQFTPSAADKQELAHELGDVLWYIAVFAHHLGVPLEDVAQHNVDKLQSRKQRGKLQGSGDNR